MAVAKIFKKLIDEHKFDIVMLGKQAIDGDYNQTGQILSAIADLPAATFASELTIEDGKAKTLREVDFGLQEVETPLPGIFTCDLRLNTPRFTKVQDILKAKKKPVETIDLAELGIDIAPRISVEKVEPPAEREGGVIVGSVDELLEKLRTEAKVL